MNATGYRLIPSELYHWITFLTQALPPRSIGTFIELLIGAMLTPTAFVTDAYLVLDMSKHWNSYYKWLEKGKWSWLGLARQFLCLVLKLIQDKEVFLLVDDTLTLRASKKRRVVNGITNTAISQIWPSMSKANAGSVWRWR